MKKSTLAKYIHKENGLTLVEIIASIAIIFLVLVSVYYLFVQSSKTTKTSEDIVDATYVAQTEMEKFYGISKSNVFPTDFKTEIFPNYKFIKEENGVFFYQNETVYPQYAIELQLKKTADTLTRVIIRVKDENKKLKSQMETTLDWGDN